jgi:di/tricarboxylate transporter
MRKIYFQIIVMIEVVLIYIFSGPILEKPDHSLNIWASRIQFLSIVIVIFIYGIVKPKYKNITVVVLLLVYIAYLLLMGFALKKE